MSGIETRLSMQTPNIPTGDPLPPSRNGCFIGRLPSELLSNIFEICSTDRRAQNLVDVINGDRDADEGKEGGNSASHDLLSASLGPPSPYSPSLAAISHVCRHWRNVAISTPSLWTTAVISPAADRPSKPQAMLLQRSRNHPIDVYLCCHLARYHNHLDLSEDDIRSMLSIFTPHVDRGRTLHVTVTGCGFIDVFLGAMSHTPVPRLTTLELYHHNAEKYLEHGSFNMLKKLTLFGGSAPLLTRIVLLGVHVDWNQPWIASAQNLTDLQLAFHANQDRPSC